MRWSHSDAPPATAYGFRSPIQDGDVKILDPPIVLGVYGTIRTHPWIDAVTLGEDAYSLFTSRAESMGWSSTGSGGMGVDLWGMNDAGQDSMRRRGSSRCFGWRPFPHPQVVDHGGLGRPERPRGRGVLHASSMAAGPSKSAASQWHESPSSSGYRPTWTWPVR